MTDIYFNQEGLSSQGSVERRRRRWGSNRYSGLMRVKVLYFGVLRERFRAADEVIELSDGVSVGALLRVLRARTSNDSMGNSAKSDLDERLWRSLAVAVNREYSLQDVVLRDGDEVALLPPVSGGLLRGGRVLRVRRKSRFARTCQGFDEWTTC